MSRSPTPPALLTVAMVAALSPACGPAASSPVRIMALVPTTRGVFEPKEVALNTLTDVPALKGSVAKLVGGAHITVKFDDPAVQGATSEDAFTKAFVRSQGSAPRANLLERGGVLWPTDFHSWNMVTAYFSFEKANEYFLAQNVASSDLPQATVYYFVDLEIPSLKKDALTDNAIYFSPIQSFLMLPFKEYQQIPLAMNPGVIAHEYSHRVFNKKVYAGRPLPEPINRWSQVSPAPGLNVLKALDEGLADFHAVNATCLLPTGCNPRFLADSVNDAEAAARDLSRPNLCMTQGLRTSLETADSVSFDSAGLQYQVGTLFASALYLAAERTGQRQAMSRAVLAAYSDASGNPGLEQLTTQNLSTPQNFTLSMAANSIVAHVGDPTLKKELCNQLLDHVQLPIAELPACPSSASGGTTCPALP